MTSTPLSSTACRTGGGASLPSGWPRAVLAKLRRSKAQSQSNKLRLLPASPTVRFSTSAPYCKKRNQGQPPLRRRVGGIRSEEHTSELQSLMRISYAVFCLKKKK